jgi:hypothetical protein
MLMSLQTRNVLSILLLALTVSSCMLPTEPRSTRVIGILSQSSNQAPVEVPEAVARGSDLRVTVTTWGTNTCWKEAGANVHVQGNVAEIVPYDLEPTDRRYACGDAMIDLPREVTLRFDAPGTAVVRVRGRETNASVGADVTVEKEIVVQ